jgi:hypothetical protein
MIKLLKKKGFFYCEIVFCFYVPYVIWVDIGTVVQSCVELNGDLIKEDIFLVD